MSEIKVLQCDNCKKINTDTDSSDYRSHGWISIIGDSISIQKYIYNPDTEKIKKITKEDKQFDFCSIGCLEIFIGTI